MLAGTIDFTPDISLQSAYHLTETTDILFFDDNVFLEKRPRELPMYMNMINALDATAWFLIGASFFCISLVMYLTDRRPVTNRVKQVNN